MLLLYLLLLQYIQVPVPSHHSVTLCHHSVTPQSPLRRESAAGCHADQPTQTMRAFRHTTPYRKAHQPTPHSHKTHPTALSLRSASRRPHLHSHTKAQKKTAPLLMLSWTTQFKGLKFSNFCPSCRRPIPARRSKQVIPICWDCKVA